MFCKLSEYRIAITFLKIVDRNIVIPGKQVWALNVTDINKIRSFASELIGQPVIKCGDCIDKFFQR